MKKIIAILMAAVTCLTVFTACKKEDKKTNVADRGAAQTQENNDSPIDKKLLTAEATPVLDDGLEAAKESLIGEWKSTENDYMMWVYFKDDVCHVDIDGMTEEGMATWTLSGDLAEVDGYYRLVAIDCTKYLNTADEGIISIYEDGKAYVFVKDGQIVWLDESEHAADDLIFEKNEAEQ